MPTVASLVEEVKTKPLIESLRTPLSLIQDDIQAKQLFEKIKRELIEESIISVIKREFMLSELNKIERDISTFSTGPVVRSWEDKMSDESKSTRTNF